MTKASAQHAPRTTARVRTNLLLLFGASVVLTGCARRPERVLPPAYSANAGQEAVETYDQDNDGALAGGELDQVPALQASRQRIDRDSDGRITAAEIDARIQQWLNARVGLIQVACLVTLNGEPLADARVRFDPEPFLGNQVPPAVGTTGPRGMATLALASDDRPDPLAQGIRCGWYKVRVTSQQESLPARYNSETILGCEVALDADWMNGGPLILELQN